MSPGTRASSTIRRNGPNGIAGDAKDKRFDTTFEDVYTAASLRDTTWYVTMGNHDYTGNFSAWVAVCAPCPLPLAERCVAGGRGNLRPAVRG